MSRFYSKEIQILERWCAAVLILALLFSVVPGAAFATTTEETAVEEVSLEEGTDSPAENSTTEEETTEETITEEPTATSSEGIAEPGTGSEESATSTLETESTEEVGTTTEELTATSTEESTATSSEESNANDGEDGEGGDSSPDTASSTATTTEDGTEGDSGSAGSSGTDDESETEETSTTTAPDLVDEPLPVVNDALIGDTDAPEDEDVTGNQRVRETDNVSITTGMATAQGEVFTRANSINARSVYDPDEVTDLDTYTFNATGTNDANVTNDVAALSASGENVLYTRGEGGITTGNAYATFNLANVINSNVINSDGRIHLASQILEPNTSLNLTEFIFPGGHSGLPENGVCNLLSCAAEDITYNVSQTNQATITNNAYIEAITGDNLLEADRADLETGNAYGTANVINVVNSNVIDSNYRLLTFNAVGDLEGNLILPTEELFEAFFGLPNGLNQLEDPEDSNINVDNVNDAVINNNLNTYAESGLNDVTSYDASTVTGNAESESNVLNRVNENVYGGDSMYLWIRIHGYWSGDVIGLPDGLTWQWTPDGVIIYNENAEITPSEFLGIDIDSYDAAFTNRNDVTIDNNINIDAITGLNEVDGWYGDNLVANVDTGKAYASANVMNIANTNVVGANWMLAVVNVLGDFDGNVTFTETDLSLTGIGTALTNPLEPDSNLVFTYTIANSSDSVATNVVLRQALADAYVTGTGGDTVQEVLLGDLGPGEETTADLFGTVDSSLAEGTTTVRAVAVVQSDQGDNDESDNSSVITFDVVVDPDPGTTTDSGTGTSSGTTTDTDTGTSTDPGEDGGLDSGSETSSGSGPSGGGGGSSKTKSIDRDEKKDLDPDSAPILVLRKTSNYDIEDGEAVAAGTEVEYTVTITNAGGNAYDTVLYDTLRNPIGAVLSEESWDLGTILAGEVITIEYVTSFDFKTPSGLYTNTASIEAYRHEDTKATGGRALKLDEAVHELEIEGVALGVGNVGVVAYYPNGTGGVSALLTWETSKPATGQVVYSPRSRGSLYNPLMPNFGYQYQSFRFNTPKTKHFMIIRNLVPGVEYAYKVRSTRGTDLALGGDYYFTVPGAVNTLTLAIPTNSTRVAGAATSSPTTGPAPVPAVPVTAIPSVIIPTPPVQKVAPPASEEPEPTPKPAPDTTTQASSSGLGISGLFGRVVSLFR